MLVTSASNTSFTREEITAADLPALPLVIRENGSGTLDVLSRELSRHGLSLRQLHIEMQLGSTESIKHYLFYSDTFAFVSVQAVLDELAANRLRGGRGGRYGTGPPVQFCHGPRPAQPTDRSFQTILPESL